MFSKHFPHHQYWNNEIPPKQNPPRNGNPKKRDTKKILTKGTKELYKTGVVVNCLSSSKQRGISALSPRQTESFLQSITKRFFTLHSSRRALVPSHTCATPGRNWIEWDRKRIRSGLHLVGILADRHATSCLPGSFLLFIELV